MDFPFCGKSSVPNRRDRRCPCAEANRCAETHWILQRADVARGRRASVNPPKQTWPKSLRPACYASPLNRQRQRSDQQDPSRISKPALPPAPCRSGPSRRGTLANRHLADDRGRLSLIDGLRMRKVGGASDGHEGKRCARYDQSFHHCIFPLGKRKQSSNLLTFPSDIPTPEACTSEYVCSAAGGIPVRIWSALWRMGHMGGTSSRGSRAATAYAVIAPIRSDTGEMDDRLLREMRGQRVVAGPD